jgi:Domain of unknown function (DUF4203)
VLPLSYEGPTAILIIAGGVLACFAGHRLFRVVLAIYGFIVGAMLASSLLGISNTAGMVAAAIGGGVLGAIVLTLAYFAGIALVGAGAGAFVAHVLWRTWGATPTAPGAVVDPPVLLVVGLSIAGAIAATLMQRYVIIIATAFGGAWTMIVGAMALMGDRAASRAASAGSVWILYPLDPAPGRSWVMPAWFALGMIGAATQFIVSGRKR